MVRACAPICTVREYFSLPCKLMQGNIVAGKQANNIKKPPQLIIDRGGLSFKTRILALFAWLRLRKPLPKPSLHLVHFIGAALNYIVGGRSQLGVYAAGEVHL